MALAVTILTPVTAACGGGDGGRDDLTVLAAASLSEPFQEIGRAFSEANPGTDVTFVFDASSALATQIEQGAPADVFASADTATMDRVVAAGLSAAPPELFATNRLAIIVAPGNPESVGGLDDLARPDLKVVLCADEVPCGRYARQVLETAAVEVRPVSLEQNVKSVVTKVTAGEADAGIVYATDVRAAGADAAGVAIPDDVNVVAEYPVARVSSSSEPAVADAFVSFLAGDEARAVLRQHGFGVP